MSAIIIKYVTENEFNNEMNIKKLSQHALALDIFLTDKVKKDQI